MKYQVWFAHGYANGQKIGQADEFGDAKRLADQTAETGSEDIQVLTFDAAGKASVLYSIGFTQLDEFCNY